jgi:ABC-2 type transport system permease protein
MTLRQNLKFIGLLIKMKLARTMAFRASFFGAFIADGTNFVIQLLTFSVIYGQVDSIGDWSRGQMIIFVGTFSMMNGLELLITWYGVRRITEYIRDGSLDHYLTKPGNVLLRLSLEETNLGSMPLLLLSGGIVAWGVSLEGIHITPLLILGYSVMVLLMTLLWYDLEIIWRTIPFFTISANSLNRLEDDIFALNFRIPGVLYKGFFKVVFYIFLPYGIMSTVPTQMLTNTLTIPGFIHALCIVIVFTAITLWFWRFGLKHYKSASS